MRELVLVGVCWGLVSGCYKWDSDNSGGADGHVDAGTDARVDAARPDAAGDGAQADGTVDAAQVVGGDLKPYSWFCNEAVRAVRRLEFEPGHLNDRPVDVRMHVTIHFRFR